MGVKHKELQQKLLEYLHVDQLELFTNGHMALELSLQAMDFPKGERLLRRLLLLHLQRMLSFGMN